MRMDDLLEVVDDQRAETDDRNADDGDPGQRANDPVGAFLTPDGVEVGVDERGDLPPTIRIFFARFVGAVHQLAGDDML